MLLDDAYPGFPGDVRNPSAFPFPIQYDIATDVSNKTLVWDQDKTPVRAPIIASAKRLERYGCRAIAAECGYFAYFQQEVATAVSVPVFTSSLLQVPFAQTLIGSTKTVAILCAQRRFLTDRHLEAVGIDPNSNLIIGDAQDELGVTEFDKLWDPEKRPDAPLANFETAERQMVEATKHSWQAIQTSAPSFMNAQGCNRFLVQHSARLACRFSIGGPCCIMPTQQSFLATTTVMFDRVCPISWLINSEADRSPSAIWHRSAI